MPSILWATATSAFFLPLRCTSRWYGAARDVPRLWEAAQAACTKAARREGLPVVVLPDLHLPADASLPGHRPAQLARCPALGKRPLSTPLSATMVCATCSI